MPAISQIRFTNVVYEEGQKRYNDDIFKFDGYNGAIVLENGGGKTVLIQTLLQAVIPHTNLGERKIRDTLKLEGPAHIAIEWIISERPRRYVVTAVSLFLSDNKVDSFKYVYEYGANDADRIEEMPFVKDDGKRPAERFEIEEYYKKKVQQSPLAKMFDTIKSYRHFIEEHYHIISDEWDSIVKINQDEGGIERFFENCKTEKLLYDRLLIPTVESSISGFDENRFADTFEEQQKSFKLYKELRAQIGEYESIEEELSAYVAANEVLYTKEQQYIEHKSRTKGVYGLANKQKEKSKQEIALLEQAMGELKVEQATLESRRDSLVIRMTEEELAGHQEQLQEITEEKERVDENVHRLKKMYYSLMLAKQKMSRHVQSELVAYYKDEITQLDKESDATHLSDELHTAHQQISGYFIEQENLLEKELTGFTHELNPIEDELKACAKESEQFQKEHIRLEKERAEKETWIDSLEKSMMKIRQTILSNTQQETVSALLPQWIKEHAQVEDSIVSLQNDTKNSRQSLIIEKEKKERLNSEITADLIDLAKTEDTVSRMEEAQLNQKEQLGKLSFSLSRIDSLYMKQSSVEQDLSRTIERLKEDKEEKLLVERVAYRFLDDYAGQDVFFADPFMEKQLQRWTNTIGLIDTGIRYLNGLNLSIDEQLKLYPYWPVTLITTAEKKTALIEKVEKVRENLLYPVHVIDLQTAKSLVEGSGEFISNAVLPLHWNQNAQAESFRAWKETLRTEADRIKGERQEVEAKLNAWEEGHLSFTNFFKKYPYEVLKETIEKEQILKDRLHLKKRLLQRCETELTRLEDTIQSNERQIADLKDQQNGFGNRILAGQQHESEAKELIHYKEASETVRLAIEGLHLDIRRLMRRQRVYEDEKRVLQENMSSITMRIQMLKSNDYYKIVKDLTPLFTDKTFELLKETAESIKLSLNELSRSRGELETKLGNARERLIEAESEIERVQSDWDEFDEQSFPENGDAEIDRLRRKEKVENEQLKEKTILLNEQTTKVAIVHSKIGELKGNFERNFPGVEIVAFNQPLKNVQSTLKVEHEKLNEQEKQYTVGLKRFGEELQKVEQALIELGKFVEAHHFNSASIEEKQLSESDANEFTYEPLRIVRQVTNEMKKASDAVKEESERVINDRHNFNMYVRRNMSDAKMRDNLIQGLEYKREFTELVEFQQNMRAKMNSVIRFNEESIRGHDEQLEHFVTYMHEHVRTVVRELEVIPTKTRIKFGTGMKQIYNFSISDWEEKEGLLRLRTYIDEILEWIEHPRYVDPECKLNSGKVRSDIEMWFATPQLLRIVLQNGDMKVSCRKVTNNNEVTSRSYSWRESNEWSGGEKWSKNMTLFLGILSYVAEKKKLLDTSMKRNRVVVLDNPFGKASSEHVLSPVFFIAEKLGFQMIALTAHAEGKFLRDYFPVMYSCRLRSAQNTEKMIMTKEKTVNAAYFQDNDPAAFERIGESEQLTLLD
ncbi:hypothetical protein ACFSFY_02240 [Sporosarcina siberiensis]|uniref:Chromosome segregation ATPase n=1 Tax=Sporosarcina siberiensis TaxID=1365606 RepID=A0ABW4SD85_9BACL